MGCRIATKALENGYQVRMLIRNPKKLTLSDDRIEIVEGNGQNSEDIKKLLKDCQIVINTFGQPLKEKQIYSSVTETILEIMADL